MAHGTRPSPAARRGGRGTGGSSGPIDDRAQLRNLLFIGNCGTHLSGSRSPCPPPGPPPGRPRSPVSFAPRTPKAAVLGLTVGALVTSGFALAPAASAKSTDARITEIHYDNAGTDTGEAIEVSAPSAVDLKNLTLVLYNGNGGASYNTKALPRPAAGQTAATARYPTNGIQNGGDDTAPGSSPDGVALVGPDGAVIEFLSYEGTFVATNGPAQGMR